MTGLAESNKLNGHLMDTSFLTVIFRFGKQTGSIYWNHVCLPMITLASENVKVLN